MTDLRKISDKIYWLEGTGYCSNTFLIFEDKGFLIIDPGLPQNYERVINILSRYDALNTDGIIILTHMHFDHIGATRRLVKKLHLKVAIHENEKNYVETGDVYNTVALLFGVDKLEPIHVDKALKNHDKIVLDGTELEIIHAPGHTTGSICILDIERGILFSGDTLFAGGSFGRTDLPTGNTVELLNSLELLESLDIKILCPGHGEIVSKDVNQNIKLAKRYLQEII